MKQFILLQTYVGPSDFTYEVTCSGRILGLDQVLALGLTTQEELRLHAASSYTAEWYEISPGDKIEVFFVDDERHERNVFLVPRDGLSDPPVKLGDERTGKNLHEYLWKFADLGD